MRKTIYSIGFLVIESVFSVGLFTSCGDQFQEEYPWLIGKQEEMDNNNEEGAGATDITVLEGAERSYSVHDQLFART